jgi:hypothetical protein
LRIRAFLKNDRGAVTVDHVVLTGGLVGLGIATLFVVSGGLADLSRDIARQLTEQRISDSFRSLVEQVCRDGGAGFGPAPAGPTGDTWNGLPVNALLIYQASDFVGGLPTESGAVAAGGRAQTLTLRADARPAILYLADDDALLHEVDDSQKVAQDITLNGDTFVAGSDVSAAYTLSDPDSGIMLSSLHFGNPFDGNWQGPVMATTASNPLEPGESYSFDRNITTHRNEQPYSAYLGCG